MSIIRNVLKLSDSAVSQLTSFYENTRDLSFEDINLSLIKIMQPNKYRDNSSYDHIIKSLNGLKNEIINDVERLLHNPDTSVPSLLEKTHNSLIEKTSIIINSSMPKYNNQILSIIVDNINDFRKVIHDDYTKLQISIDNNNMKEFVQNFDLKLSMLMQNLQQPLYSSIHTLEDKLSNKFRSICNDIIHNQDKMHNDLLTNINNLKVDHGNSHSISPTSKPIKVILTPIFPMAEISNCIFDTNTINLKRIHKQNILLKSFDWDDNVSVDEITNFLLLLDDHQSNGILISNKSGIAAKKNYEIEIHNNKIIVFLHNVEYNGSLISCAVDIIDSLTNKLSQYINTKDEFITIPKEIMDTINNEYHIFAAQKISLIELLKEQQKRVISQIDELRFPALDKYLSSKYLVPISKPGLKCDLCKLYTATNLKALAAHKRGCARKHK